METIFVGNTEIQVLRNGKEVIRVTRPLRLVSAFHAVRYKNKLWRVRNNSIELTDSPLVEDDQPTSQTDEGMGQAQATDSGGETSELDVAPVAGESIAVDIASADKGQELIISATYERRLLVDAGPGTGKTHTACLKVVDLIKNNDIPPSRIWMISFTRTAVFEIRNRLAALLDDPSDAATVRIATLDSLGWTIHSGFSKDAVLTGSYDDNISQTLAKIRDNPEVREELEKVRHIVVDEAQDIVGVRAELVLAIVDAVLGDCGVTAFADKAQAIYGFTEDEMGDSSPGIRLLDTLKERGFTTVCLTEIHRTKSPTLLHIFRDVREKVLRDSNPSLTRGSEIHAEIKRVADADIGPARNLKLGALPQTSLVLMRQRCDVLIASSFSQDTPHRLRMSGLPVRVLPWLALLLWDYGARRLIKDDFEKLWQQRLTNRSDMPLIDECWRRLFEAAGESSSVIDLHRLRSILSRSNPPAAFTSPEYGDSGPIIGTIHASKGREADEVFLYLPPPPEQEENGMDTDEEIRVMFVGATRARNKLSVGYTSGRHLGNHDGRFWKKITKGRLQIEIGRAHDIDALGLVGKSVFASPGAAKKAQGFISEKPLMTGLFARQCADHDWKYILETPGKVKLGALSERVKADVRGIAQRCESWPPPNYLPHIRSIGLRSLVVSADNSFVDQLHEPWRSSGFLLAPMLIGVCTTKLKQ